MIELLVHYDDNHNEATANPSELDIVTAINSLDGITKLIIMLSSTQGYLFVHASQQQRMHVSYTRDGGFAAYLIDTNESPDRILKFAHGNGEIDEWSVYETVAKETALEIATVFFRNDAFPKGTAWKGNIEDLPIVS